MAKSNQNDRILEKNKQGVPIDDSLSCPRMVTRLWGIIVAIGKYDKNDGL